MNEIYNFHGQEVRTVTINNEPYFVGKDVAEILAYKEPNKAITRHVDEEDRTKHPIPTKGGIQDSYIINESGLYSLILSSKLPQAKEFKRWVPKWGRYIVLSIPMCLGLSYFFVFFFKFSATVSAIWTPIVNSESTKLIEGEK